MSRFDFESILTLEGKKLINVVLVIVVVVVFLFEGSYEI